METTTVPSPTTWTGWEQGARLAGLNSARRAARRLHR